MYLRGGGRGAVAGKIRRGWGKEENCSKKTPFGEVKKDSTRRVKSKKTSLLEMWGGGKGATL